MVRIYWLHLNAQREFSLNQIKTGLFGKLPAHGDFVMRDLPAGFVNAWDEWLQHYIAGSKEQLGESWLNTYLTSPIWRFVFSDGVLDKNCWAGVMLPSVDRVGRYYPLSAVRQLPDASNPLEVVNVISSWFASVEELMFQSLNGEMNVDALSASINNIGLNLDSVYKTNPPASVDNESMQINMEFEEQLPSSVYQYLVEPLLRNSLSSFSVWTTAGSDFVEPCIFLTQGMPPISKLTSMIDGQWAGRGWYQPYKLKLVEDLQLV